MSYTIGRDPSSSRLDSMRLLVGDIDPEEPMLTDDEIEYYLTLSQSDYVVASMLCTALCGVMARQVATQVGPLKEEAQLKFDHYLTMSREFYSLGTMGGPMGVYSTGTAIPINTAATGECELPFFTRRWPR